MDKKEIQRAYDSVYPTFEQRERMFKMILSEKETANMNKKVYTAKPQKSGGWKLAATAAMLVAMTAAALTGILTLNDQPLADDTTTTEKFTDSSFYKASMEWYDIYTTSGDVERGNVTYPYNLYGCRNQIMESEINKILDAYGLGIDYGYDSGTDSFEFFMESVGIESVFRTTDGVTYETNSCFWAKDGTFDFGGTTTMSYAGTPWSDPIYYAFHTTSKNNLDYIFIDLGPLEDYEHWEYTTENGETLILGHNATRSLIILDTEDTVVHIWIGTNPAGEYNPGDKPLTREALEAFAETFDFSSLT